MSNTFIQSNDDALWNKPHKLHFTPKENIEDKHLRTRERSAFDKWVIIISDHSYNNWVFGSFMEVALKPTTTTILSIYSKKYRQGKILEA